MVAMSAPRSNSGARGHDRGQGLPGEVDGDHHRIARRQMGDRDAALLAVEIDAAMPQVFRSTHSTAGVARDGTMPPACPASRRAGGRRAGASRLRARNCPTPPLRRNALGGRPNRLRKVSLKRRTLPKPGR